MFERFHEKARRALFFARYEASRNGSPCIEPEHYLLALIHEDPDLFNRLGLGPSMESIRRRLEEALATPHQESAQAVLSTDLPLSESSKLVNKNTVKEADLLGHMGIGTDHMLLGVLATETEPPCLAKSILNELGCYLENTRVIVLAIGPYQ